MTHEVVQSDVEFATRLIEAGCKDNTIVASLCWRGVDESAAASLVSQLHRKQAFQPKRSDGEITRAICGLGNPQRSRKRRRRSARPSRIPPLPRGHWRHHRRLGDELLSVVGALIAFAGVASLCYCAVDEWYTLKARWQRADPHIRERMSRFQEGLPQRVDDDLKNPPPNQ